MGVRLRIIRFIFSSINQRTKIMGGILSTDKSSSAEELQFFLNLLRLSRVVEDGKADKETWKEIAKVIGMYREYLKTNLPATKEVKTTLNKTIPSHAVEGKQEKNKEKRLVDIEIRNPFNKTTPRMKIQGHEPLLFLQKGIGNYPDLSTLEGVKLFPVKEVDLEAGTKVNIFFLSLYDSLFV